MTYKTLSTFESPALALVAEEWQQGNHGHGTSDLSTELAQMLENVVDMLSTCTAQLRTLTDNDAVYDDNTGKSITFETLELFTGTAYARAAKDLAAVANEHALLSSAHAKALLSLVRPDIKSTRAALLTFELTHNLNPAFILR